MHSIVRALVVTMLVLACDGSSATQTEPSRSTVPPNEATWTAEPGVGPTEAPQAESPRSATPYDRSAWPHWIDEDHDCQDARTEVLIAESFGELEFEDPRRCEIATGEWQCPYTGEIIREAHLLDVDHLVPLANAHRSGGATWDTERRRQYANDLSQTNHLIAVEYGANRSKGDKGPEAWLPPSEEFRCTYIREWKAIKTEWKLGMTPDEAAAVATGLEACEAGRVPPLPQTRPKPAKAAAPREPSNEATHEAAECCKVCKKGKACGDGCISRESSCTKPRGCACDG
jgi:hypothetical protein